jgi:hypothetical protein
LSVLSFFASTTFAQTEGTLVEKEHTNFISVNLGQYFINEINLGYEHFISKKNSIEVNGGIIYRNEFWLNLASDWVNSQYFREQGFAARVYYKTYKKANEKNNNKTFYSFGLNYQYLYFNDEWINTNKIGTVNEYITQDSIIIHSGPEEILMHRTRHRLGIQLMMGNVIPAGNNFAIEVYYGLGVRGIFSNRVDVARRLRKMKRVYWLSEL